MLYSCVFLVLVFMVILGTLIALGDLRWLDVKAFWCAPKQKLLLNAILVVSEAGRSQDGTSSQILPKILNRFQQTRSQMKIDHFAFLNWKLREKIKKIISNFLISFLFLCVFWWDSGVPNYRVHFCHYQKDHDEIYRIGMYDSSNESSQRTE